MTTGQSGGVCIYSTVKLITPYSELRSVQHRSVPIITIRTELHGARPPLVRCPLPLSSPELVSLQMNVAAPGLV